MTTNHLERAQHVAKQCLRQYGEPAPKLICTRETDTLYGFESQQFVCIVNKSNARILWVNRRKSRSTSIRLL